MPKAQTGNEGTENDDEIESGDESLDKGKPAEEGNEVIETDGAKKPAADAAKPDAAKPDKDGKKKPDKAEPENVEDAIRQSLGLKKPVDDKAAAKPEGEVDEAGKPKAKVAKEEPEKPEKPAEKAKPDLYAVPEGIKEKATERFHQLVTSHKELTTVVESQKQTLEGFKTMVKETGADDEQFVMALDLLTLINKDPAAAAQRLYDLSASMALRANVDIPGVDYLKDYTDLQKQVEDREITSASAREIAKSRREKNDRETRETQERETTKQTERRQAYQQATLKSIETFLQDKETSDIDWQAKAPILLKAAQFAQKNLQMSEWLPYLQNQYEQVAEIVAKAGKPADNGGGKRPLRPSGGGGGNKVPGTMEEAIRQGLGLPT